MNRFNRSKTLWLAAASTFLGTTLGTCQTTLNNAFTEAVRLSVLGLLDPRNFGF